MSPGSDFLPMSTDITDVYRRLPDLALMVISFLCRFCWCKYQLKEWHPWPIFAR